MSSWNQVLHSVAMKFTTDSKLLLRFLAIAAVLLVTDIAHSQARPCAGDTGQSSSSHPGKNRVHDFNRAFIDACRSMNQEAAAQLWQTMESICCPAWNP